MLDPSILGISAPVALAVVAVLGYWFGRRQGETAEQQSARRELKRAKTVVRELEKIAQQVRSHLAHHHRSVIVFKQSIQVLNQHPDEVDWQKLSAEAEKMLAPTQQLAAQIAQAYDLIRQQANQLVSFAEVRTDPLTGLSNRRALDEALTSLLTLRARYGNLFSVVFFDIDHFKRINDERGHVQGDQVLQQLAAIFDQYVRETDIAARFGGEEFVIVLPGANLEGACIFAERMRVTVQKLCQLTISGGVAEAAEDDNVASLLQRADAALYAAKNDGRNRVFRHLSTGVEPVYSTESQLQEGHPADKITLLNVRQCS